MLVPQCDDGWDPFDEGRWKGDTLDEHPELEFCGPEGPPEKLGKPD